MKNEISRCFQVSRCFPPSGSFGYWQMIQLPCRRWYTSSEERARRHDGILSATWGLCLSLKPQLSPRKLKRLPVVWNCQLAVSARLQRMLAHCLTYHRRLLGLYLLFYLWCSHISALIFTGVQYDICCQCSKPAKHQPFFLFKCGKSLGHTGPIVHRNSCAVTV